jgi:acetyltransferase-like isoleucine patch superfamily enzyme
MTYPFASLGRDLSVHYTFMVNRAMVHRVKLGNSVIISKDVWLNIIPEATDAINIVIEDNCRLGPRTWISARNFIHLEQDVKVGPSVLIMDHGHTYVNPNVPIRVQPPTPGGRIRIEKGCRIGHGAVIVCTGKELVLGHNSVVAPNAMIVRSYPPYSVISGNPSRVIDQLDPSMAVSMP